MIGWELPPEVDAVLATFRTCELSTLARDGTPITWPVSALWEPRPGHFLRTTCVGRAQKAVNIRRNPRVALLFSDPTGSGLRTPPTVLVQGDATAPDELRVVDGLEDYWRMIFARQRLPAYLSITNPLLRRGMDWYYMRIAIHVAPRRILWWPAGQPERTLLQLEGPHVD